MKLIIPLSFYLLAIITFYAFGYSFHIDWLTFRSTSYFSSGTLQYASQSILPFVLALPIYWIASKQIKPVNK
ncbi:hypothetical protein QUF88_23445 [Bacillus sp. DX1.1]|uniref:hypothetical protein n=1 Tax=unclassified Bacillus (in: firmicutes) TaxID=185979 RepID=UPI0025712C26|nr:MULTISPECIES: hypothetical protein [unclassified Bacillus (in: firmicutes)]MDM5156671.1 hypothetical protein [Bacillus sp. DX1.1]WJE80927.1 hypothetical protein QRE67_20985 [Bacillus sp. DX3.1]